MRRRLSTLVSDDRAVVNHSGSGRNACAHHETWVVLEKRGPRKEKPGGGNAGSDLFVIGVYGFKYAAWLLLVAPESAERLVVIVQPTFCSCSSTFLFFFKVSKFNRTLCEFASFSVCCALTRPWVGTTHTKQDTCPSLKNTVGTGAYARTDGYRIRVLA